MPVTSVGTAFVLNTVTNAVLNSGNLILSLKNGSAELFRKAPAIVDVISSTKKVYNFYLTENEGNGTITSISLYGNGATETLGTGTELVTATANINKTASQSLTINWTVEVK